MGANSGPAAKQRRVDRRDRPWLDAYNVALCGPLDLPTATELESAIVELAAAYPHSRVAWVLDQKTRRWRTSAPVVSIRSGDPTVDVGRTLDRTAGDVDFTGAIDLVRYEKHLAMRISHGICDGAFVGRILAAIYLTARAGEAYRWPGSSRDPRFPLTRTIMRKFATKPSSIRAAVADRPAALTGSSTELEPWARSRRTMFATTAPETYRKFIASGRQAAPNASRFAIQVAAGLRALAAVGLAVQPQVSVIFDLRRYGLSPDMHGNFVVGVPMDLAATDSPEKISRAIRSTAESGRPLLTQVLTTSRLSRPPTPSTTAPAHSRAAVAFSSLGQPPGIRELPFDGSAAPLFAGAVEPGGPTGLTFLFIELAGALHTSISFHDNVIDPVLVRSALDLFGAHPDDLVTG